MKTHSLEKLTDKYIGKIGTPKRDEFESELRLDLLGQAIKQARQARKLTQDQLGELVGVKKAQISKIENSATDARFATILKVFKALDAKVNFSVELNKVPAVRIDKSLNKYAGKVLFPEKVEKARKAFEELGTPDNPKKKGKKTV
jgi:transcriptional regulator with XRE-family HTH domain